MLRARPLEPGSFRSRCRVGALRKAWLSSADWDPFWSRPCWWQEGGGCPGQELEASPRQPLGLPSSHGGQFCGPGEGLPWGPE